MLDELALNEESWAVNHAAQEKMVDALIGLAFLRYGVDAYRVIGANRDTYAVAVVIRDKGSWNGSPCNPP